MHSFCREQIAYPAPPALDPVPSHEPLGCSQPVLRKRDDFPLVDSEFCLLMKTVVVQLKKSEQLTEWQKSLMGKREQKNQKWVSNLFSLLIFALNLKV